VIDSKVTAALGPRLEKLSQSWINAKQTEQASIDTRRAIEDELVRLLAVDPSEEGKDTRTIGLYEVKIVNRLTRKVDSDKIQEIAAEKGLSEHLSQLLRWKPEINMTVWKRADEKITKPLLGAVTTTPGRPSFTITRN
jgi:hypothetical protein